MTICKKCGSENTDNAKFCLECGANLVEQKKESEITKCINCGAELPVKAKFCSECSASQIIEIKENEEKKDVESPAEEKIESEADVPKTIEKLICPSCNAELPHMVKFCPKCGSKLAFNSAGNNENVAEQNDIPIPDVETPLEAFEYAIEEGLYILKNLKTEYRSVSKIVIPNVFSIIGLHESDNSDCKYEGAFQNCDKLTEVVIPDSIFYIDDWAFKDCVSLSKINIPSSVTFIGSGAFFGCSRLRKMNLPDSIGEISDYAFMKSGLSDIKLPSSVKKIGFRAFAECGWLPHIKIPDTVTDIEEEAFKGADLREIIIPETVRTIGNYSFDNCFSLKKIDILNPKYDVKDIVRVFGYGFQCNEVAIGTKKINISKLTAFGNLFKSVGHEMFNDIDQHPINYYGHISTEEKLPKILWTKEQTSKENAPNVNFADGMTETPVEAFDYIIKDGEHILTGVKKEYQSLTEIVIPSFFTKIQNPHIQHFKDESLYIYACHSRKDFQVFGACEQLQSVIIPNTVNEIGSCTFFNCKSLKHVVIPSSVKKIGSHAFDGCSNLSEIVIPVGIIRIEKYTFDDCESLSEIIIPEGVITIESGAFSRCKSLRKVIIPDTVKEIGSAFDGCESLYEINIPEGVIKIGEYAFCECKSLRQIVIPQSVMFLEEGIFYNCIELTDVEILNDSISLKEINKKEMFFGCLYIKRFVIGTKSMPINKLRLDETLFEKLKN